MAQHNARTKRSEKGLLNSGQLRCWSWVCRSAKLRGACNHKASGGAWTPWWLGCGCFI